MGRSSIYDKYGGFDFFHSCIYELYRDMYDRPEIAYHFIGVDIDKLSKHQTQYLVRQIGGPKLYQGGPIKWVHKDMDITPFQFDEIAKAFRQVFIDKGVEKADVEVIMDFIAAQRGKIVTAKWSLMDALMLPIYRFKAWLLSFL